MSPEKVYKIFGSKLKELRKEEKLTQEELAEKMGVSKTTIVNYENGNRKVPLEVVVKLANYFNVPVDSLLNNDIKHVSNIKLWQDEFKNIIFTDHELEQIIKYAHFLIYLRRDNINA